MGILSRTKQKCIYRSKAQTLAAAPIFIPSTPPAEFNNILPQSKSRERGEWGKQTANSRRKRRWNRRRVFPKDENADDDSKSSQSNAAPLNRNPKHQRAASPTARFFLHDQTSSCDTVSGYWWRRAVDAGAFLPGRDCYSVVS